MENSKTKKILGTRQMVLSAMFVVLIAIGGFIKIPVPPVPISLQSLFVLLAGVLLGSIGGTTAVAVYVILGLIGLPIFAAGGGIAYVLKPSFGYILGFIPAAFVTGLLSRGAFEKSEKRAYVQLMLANLVGTAIIYALGLVYLYFMMKFYMGKDVEIWGFLYTGMIIFLPGDLLKCVISTVASRIIAPMLNRRL